MSDASTHHQVEVFQKLTDDWTIAKAEYAQACRAAEETGEDSTSPTSWVCKADDQVDRLVQLIMTTPAPLKWMMLKKFALLEEAVERGELRLCWMVAGIKADVMALPI